MVAPDAQYLGFVVKAEEEGEEVTVNIYKKLIVFVLVGLIPRDLFLHFVPSPPYLEELLAYGSQSQAVCQKRTRLPRQPSSRAKMLQYNTSLRVHVVLAIKQYA